MTGDLGAVTEGQKAVGAFQADTHGSLRGHNLDSKTPRLSDSAHGQVCTGEAGGETEIVFDARTQSSLTARRFAFDDDGSESFGGSVHRSGESGGPTADDRDVVEVEAGAGTQSDPARDLLRVRLIEPIAVREEDHRQLQFNAIEAFHEPLDLRVALGGVGIQP